jgi:prevent-host-death family protein
MKRINLDEDIKSLSDFRVNAASYVKRVRKTKRPMVITQHGKSSAVLLDVTEYEALMEKLEVLQDIHLAQEQIASGKSFKHTDAKNEVIKQIHQ